MCIDRLFPVIRVSFFLMSQLLIVRGQIEWTTIFPLTFLRQRVNKKVKGRVGIRHERGRLKHSMCATETNIVETTSVYIVSSVNVLVIYFWRFSRRKKGINCNNSQTQHPISITEILL